MPSIVYPQRQTCNPLRIQVDLLFLTNFISAVFQELWEENLSAAVTLQILEIVEKFMDAAAVHVVVTDYVKLDCITTIFTGFLSRSQPLPFWKYFLPVFNNLFRSHGATLMSRENDRFLKQVVFHLLRLAVFRNESIRKRAVVGLQILVRVSFNFLSFSIYVTEAHMLWFSGEV